MDKKLLAVIFVAGGAILTIIGCFLPFIGLGAISASLSWINAKGMLAFVFIIASAALGIIELVAKKSVAKWAIIPAVITLIFLVLDLMDVFSTGMSLAIGAWVCIVGVCATLVGSIVCFTNKKDASVDQA